MVLLLEGLGVREPLRHRTEPDHIEALVATGATDRAAEMPTWLERRNELVPRPWVAASLPRSRALLQAARGDVVGAAAGVANAIDSGADNTSDSFPAARHLLVLGQLERRLGHRRAAGERLDRAIALFDDLPAAAWVARARQEIDRLGRRRDAGEGLTPAETRVVELIATGLTNRAVADRLVLSPKTVEAHLARAYAKLGVRSRAELGHRLADRTSEAFKAAAYANAVYDLASSADIVTFTVAGHVRLGDPGNGQEYVLAGSSFCTMAGGCICPPGTQFVGAPPNRLSTVTLLAVTGGQTGATGSATGHSLEEFCKPDPAGDVWSFVFWSPDLGDGYPPLMVGYTCDGLASTWKAIYLPSTDGLIRTFEMPFADGPIAHLDFHWDIPAAGQSAAVTVDFAVDFELDPAVDPPVIKVSGTKTETQGGQTWVVPPRDFGSDAPLELKNVSLETQLKPYRQYQHPFRAQALQECGG